MLKTLLICLALLSLNVSAALSDNSVVSPQTAQKMGSLNISGIHLGMSIEEAISTLKRQGYNLVCGSSACTFREGNIMISIAPKRKTSHDRKLVDRSLPVRNISYTITGLDLNATCPDIYNATKQLCEKGLETFPCKKRNKLVKAAIIPRERSQDGCLYRGKIKMDIRSCQINISCQK